MASTAFRYDPKTLVADDLRAAVGILFCFGPLVAVEASPVMVYILAPLGMIFLVFGLRTLLRHVTTVELTAEGLQTAGLRRQSLPWHELSGMKLAYFSTRRDKKKGWMELKVTGGATRMAFDSSLDGFEAVVEAAFHAARANGIALSEVTRSNLDALGFAQGLGAMPDDHL